MPITRQAITSNALGNNIQRGGSCGFLGKSVAGGPKNTCMIKRSEYATLNIPHITAIAGKPMRVIRLPLMNTVSAKNISFDRKPLRSGTPAIAAAPTTASVAVMGMARCRPLRRDRSRVPVSWSTMPAAMNSDALNVAWFTIWKMAAINASELLSPSSSVIRPKWLIVEYASTPFMSR